MTNRFGFVKVAAATPLVKIADCHANAEAIDRLTAEAVERGVSVVVFPELSLTGYTCGDLFLQSRIIEAGDEALEQLLATPRPIVSIIGMPIYYKNNLYNCAVVIANGKIEGIVPKSYIPNYSEFYESRWFSEGRDIRNAEITICGQKVRFGADLLFNVHGVKFGVEICEDLWVPAPPSSDMALAGATLIFNLSATPEILGKHSYLRSLIKQQSARSLCGYIYASAGVGESSTDLVFTGNGIIAENGKIIAARERFVREARLTVADIDVEHIFNERRRHTSFINLDNRFDVIKIDIAQSESELEREVNPAPFIPVELEEGCAEAFTIQTAGLAQRLSSINCKCAVIGISGGLDSTLALLVTAATFDMLGLDRKGIIGVTMPGFGTTDRTYQNALTLMAELGITTREISIRKACEQHFEDIGLNANERGAAYENSQARERTQILMDLANLKGGIVIGTGDLSEAALGWATYNGDSMSMYNPNCSIPKTLVRKLVEWCAENNQNEQVRATLKDIVDTPVSPELLPADSEGNIAQKTEDLVGPYALHDFFIYNFLRNGFSPAKIEYLACRAFCGEFSKEEIKHWLQVFLRRFFSQQFKRSAAPDGPKVVSVSLSPRGDLRMPSDASVAEWLK
ncbi:MAG: NAD(+) synthase [Alistipes sp.]|nr:NAD(+) synthase [Alistipes sp.]